MKFGTTYVSFPMASKSKSRKTAGTSSASGGAGASRDAGSPSGSSPVRRVLFGDDAPLAYAHVDVTVDISKVAKTAHVVRKTDASHETVQDFVDMFRRGKYGFSGDCISVAVIGLPESVTALLIKHLTEGPKDDRELTGLEGPSQEVVSAVNEHGVVYVDGMHRGAALLDEEVRKVTPTPRARLYYRKDYKPMKELDVLTMGTLANQSSSKTIKMTVEHRVCAMVSIGKSLLSVKQSGDDSLSGFAEAEKELIEQLHGENMDSRVLNELCKMRNINADIQERQGAKYCRIAAGILKFPNKSDELISVMQKISNVNVVSGEGVWESETSDRQLFVLKGLTVACEATKTNKRDRDGVLIAAKLRTEKTASSYARRFGDLWDTLVQYAGSKKMTVADVLKIRVRRNVRTRNDFIPMSEKVEEMLGSIDYAQYEVDDPNMWTELQTKVKGYITKYRAPSEEAGAPADSAATAQSAAGKAKADAEDSSSGSSEEESEGSSSGGSDDEEGEERSPLKLGSPSPPVTLSAPAQPSPGDAAAGGEEPGPVTAPTPPSSNVMGREGDEYERTESDTDKNPVPPTEPNPLPIPPPPVPDTHPTVGGKHPRKTFPRGTPPGRKKKSSRKGGSAKSNRSQASSSRDGSAGGASRRSARLQGKASKKMMDADEESEEESAESESEEVRAVVPRSLLAIDMAQYKTKENEVSEPADLEGFQVTHRWREGFAYNLPMPRTDGSEAVEKEKEVDNPNDPGAMPWYHITFKDMDGGRSGIRLFEDREPGLCTIDPSWKLDTSPMERSHEENFVECVPAYDSVSDMILGGHISAQKLLRSMGFRPPHRSMFMLSVGEIEHLRRFLFYRLLRNNTSFGVGMAKVSSADVTGDAITSMVSDLRDVLFSGMRNKLDATGYVVFNGILQRDEEGTEDAAGWADMFSDVAKSRFPERLQEFYEFFEGHVPTSRQFEQSGFTEDQKHIWRSIRELEEEDEGVSEVSRLTTSLAAMTVMLEQHKGEEGRELLRTRSKLDVVIMMLCRFLRLDYAKYKPNLEEDRDAPPLNCPDTGGRLILTLKDTKYQGPHKDYHVPYSVKLKRDGSAVYPPYFAMTSTDKATALWVADGSHRWAGKSSSELENLAKSVKLRLIFIPPHSVYIVNGFLFHAGGGGRESRGDLCTRYHLYVLRHGIPLADGFDTNTFFKMDEEDIEEDWEKLVEEV